MDFCGQKSSMKQKNWFQDINEAKKVVFFSENQLKNAKNFFCEQVFSRKLEICRLS